MAGLHVHLSPQGQGLCSPKELFQQLLPLLRLAPPSPRPHWQSWVCCPSLVRTVSGP